MADTSGYVLSVSDEVLPANPLGLCAAYIIIVILSPLYVTACIYVLGRADHGSDRPAPSRASPHMYSLYVPDFHSLSVTSWRTPPPTIGGIFAGNPFPHLV